MINISANSKDNQITENSNPIIMKAELTNSYVQSFFRWKEG